MRFLWRVHRAIYRLSGGRIGSQQGGHEVLSLTTIGNKSGKPRTILIWYFPYGESSVIIGTNAGADWHPAWYLNLQANPEADVQIGRKHFKVRARTAEGEERQKLWDEITSEEPVYAEYQAQLERLAPVVVLDPL